MKAVAKDWVLLAEASYAVIELFQRRWRGSPYRILCFHARETVRKYLIALQEETGFSVGEKWSPALLDSPFIARLRDWGVTHRDVRRLDRYDERLLYPGHHATRADARTALKACRSMRAEIRASLGLPKK